MFSQHMPAHLLLTMQRLAKERTGDTQARPPVPAGTRIGMFRRHLCSGNGFTACAGTNTVAYVQALTTRTWHDAEPR